MSAAQLCRVAASLGFPQRLAPDSVEWAFNVPGVQPFLYWICEELGPDNVLTDTERAAFARLEAAGLVLDGEEMEKAQQHLNYIQRVEMPIETLRAEASALRDAVAANEARIALLAGQRDRLAALHLAEQQRVSDAVATGTEAAAQLKSVVERAASCGAELDRALEKVVVATQRASLRAAGCAASEDAIGKKCMASVDCYLSQLSLDDMLKADDQFMKELNCFFVKQFHGELGALAASDETLHYALLDLARPETLLIRGEPEVAHSARVQELSRLQNAMVLARVRLLRAKMSLAEGEVALEEVKRSRSAHYSPWEARSSNVRDAQQQELETMIRKAQELEHNDIPRAARELCALQLAAVLHVDYDLKLARQRYFLDRQRLFVQYLYGRAGRLATVAGALAFERRQHAHTSTLLASLFTELDSQAVAHLVRLDCAKKREELARESQRETLSGLVSSHDALALRGALVADAVPRGEGLLASKERLQKEKLEETCAALRASLRSAEEAVASRRRDAARRAERERALTSAIKDFLSSEAVTFGDMADHRISRAARELESCLEDFSSALDSLLRQRQERQLRLAHQGAELTIERALCGEFFNSPDVALKRISELEARLAAMRRVEPLR